MKPTCSPACPIPCCGPTGPDDYTVDNGFTGGKMSEAQDDYCEACRAYHVGADHGDDVPTECGQVSIQGFDVVLDCNRPPHQGIEHRTIYGTTWVSPQVSTPRG